jgi:tetratricopeptide (TPR) repeat protein
MIKSIFIALATFLATISFCSAQTPQHRFEEANNLFNQSKYTEAAKSYQQLLDEGYNQTALYFNAGNAWYKAGKVGMAVYSYEKALQLSPNDKAVKHNLDVVNQKVEGYVNELPLVFFQQWWLTLEHFHHPNGWAVGMIIFFWLLIAGIMVNKYIPGLHKKWLNWTNYGIGALFALYTIMAITSYCSANNHSTGIIMVQNKAKSAPDESSRDIFEVGEGVKVDVTDATNDFCKIELADGKNGWISCNAIKRL